ncbi:uncharacterized protein LOC126895567 isoform X15 [Daktulosphaira vitifoliae]|uniref:uncharacterized protein LOC126895567 isoform X12 n=1 Tax=Daktulosphaira vitifoliae TaxID=58002 RepID=UPI0021AA646A|nr:uncharacterized protein LOC126895567 isoform X12 [Daktulosphaira vitifoliae]XP_050523532.1 uncharacterized protein LOC126895567 isoform X13 [Daktulosphaira vitifoliae]XP_050523533.1 uncharacterized protein LOC126895567 isoform X14 [Daktulosphaira vitifoliae]XP_050523534.1 uncharacterized protein LOC126895567 isoform X15 [Daktulosphaira vitifoliae]
MNSAKLFNTLTILFAIFFQLLSVTLSASFNRATGKTKGKSSEEIPAELYKSLPYRYIQDKSKETPNKVYNDDNLDRLSTEVNFDSEEPLYERHQMDNILEKQSFEFHPDFFNGVFQCLKKRQRGFMLSESGDIIEDDIPSCVELDNEVLARIFGSESLEAQEKFNRSISSNNIKKTYTKIK